MLVAQLNNSARAGACLLQKQVPRALPSIRLLIPRIPIISDPSFLSPVLHRLREVVYPLPLQQSRHHKLPLLPDVPGRKMLTSVGLHDPAVVSAFPLSNLVRHGSAVEVAGKLGKLMLRRRLCVWGGETGGSTGTESGSLLEASLGACI